ncbi:MAG: tRNA epoxyqueuosine(34) reductase QueG [Candidatus Eremiobacteraeota bacterium]|nr:tRNA epoxyqueuosine(34) reductase QueG [Candidatus Eremiobacteraeota bacterium]MBV8499219.1 tRNA epoxyqueuosine(34) reductase QueG [Candidatus Eremiobacteraeota bacterium]
MNATELIAIKRRAVEKAKQLGAGDVRVVVARADEASRRRMTAAFRRGDLAAWGYDGEYARRATDPTTLLPTARSVVCVALPYATDAPDLPGRLRGRVSNYAWSTDYHRRLRALLSAVAREIDDAAGAKTTAIACDTRPLAERALAASAGVGWIGKHTNLISPSLGSFVFLGEVVTTLELPSDAPLRKSCGACRRCVDACPTRALRGDYTIDANRCISDLTQRAAGIPASMRAMLGDWVWGCDLCQLVCPPTASARRGASPHWKPRDAETARPALLELLRLRSSTFKRRFRDTAMGWRGAAVLRRNAAVALGNALDRSAVDALIESMRGDPHPMVRGHAAWALGRIGSPAALAALRGQQAVESDDAVRGEIRSALEPFQAR